MTVFQDTQKRPVEFAEFDISPCVAFSDLMGKTCDSHSHASQSTFDRIRERHMDNLDSESPIRRLGSLPVQISVRVCSRSLKLDELLQWVPGTVLLFDRPASEPLAIWVGGRPVGQGQAVTVGPKVGLRLLQFGKESN